MKRWAQDPVSLAVAFGAGVLVVGLVAQFGHHSSTGQSNIKTGLTGRDVAIAQATKDGKKSYSFTTGFIPGVGFITNAESYKNQWLQDQQ